MNSLFMSSLQPFLLQPSLLHLSEPACHVWLIDQPLSHSMVGSISHWHNVSMLLSLSRLCIVSPTSCTPYSPLLSSALLCTVNPCRHSLLCHFVSYRTVLYRIAPYNIVSYRIVSYRTVLNRIAPYRTVLNRIAPYRIVSFCNVSYRIVLCCVVSHRVVLYCLCWSHRILPDRTVSYWVISAITIMINISQSVTEHPIVSYPALPCPVMPREVVYTSIPPLTPTRTLTSTLSSTATATFTA